MMIDQEFRERAAAKARDILEQMEQSGHPDFALALEAPEAFVDGFVRGVDALTRLQFRRAMGGADNDWLSEEQSV